MNFLTLCQRLRMEAGISGTGPAAVTGQTGELLEVVTWINSAYADIQNLHTSWRFRHQEFTGTLISGTAEYTPAALAITDLAEWKTDDTRIYLAAADEQWIQYIPWPDFRFIYLKGTVPTGRPSSWSIKPNNSIYFYPTPNDAFTARGEYVKDVDELSGNTDEPIFPSRYHMGIVWRALIQYAGLLSAPEKYAHGESEYKRIIRAMEISELPKFTYGAPLA